MHLFSLFSFVVDEHCVVISTCINFIFMCICYLIIFVLSFGIITDLVQWKLNIFILLYQTLVLISVFFLIVSVHVVNCHASFVIFWHMPALAIAYILHVVHFSMPFTTPAIDWLPPWLISISAIVAIDMSLPFAYFCFIKYIVLLLVPFHGLNP